jgi:hypothetical protein
LPQGSAAAMGGGGVSLGALAMAAVGGVTWWLKAGMAGWGWGGGGGFVAV